jgi:hypothetical protein
MVKQEFVITITEDEEGVSRVFKVPTNSRESLLRAFVLVSDGLLAQLRKMCVLADLRRETKKSSGALSLRLHVLSLFTNFAHAA